jgi:NADH dehydrogenase FAD-containing subunit
MHKYTDPKKQALVDRAQAAIQQAEQLKRDLIRIKQQAGTKPKESK